MSKLTKKALHRVSIFAGIILAVIAIFSHKDAIPGISMDFINKVQADGTGGGGGSDCSDGCSSCNSAGGTASDSASASGEGGDSGDSGSCADSSGACGGDSAW